MPELPEVEVTRRGIDPRLRGARVLAVRLGKPLRRPLGCPPGELVGAHLGPVQRRGKYLWLPMSPAAHEPGPGAARHGGLLLHLGMSGSLAWLDRDTPPGPHDHFDLVTSQGLLRLTDPRRFGVAVWSPGLDEKPAADMLAGLGPEPFDPALTPRSFHEALHRRRAPIKAVLLSGEAIVGAGNIYACEALFLAGIDPRTPANRISRPRAERLLSALRETLSRAIGLGGSTLRDFRDVHGAGGAYQAQARVYGREGEPCLHCDAAVRRIVQAQRSSYFCPRCQRR